MKDYIVGTVLGENEYRIGDKVYQFTEADKVSEYIEPVLPDTENGEVVYDGKIYNITDAVNTGVEYVAPVLPDAENGEVVYDGKIYDISDAVNTGVKYEEGTVLQEDEIVYNGYVYSNVENKGDYFEGTQLEEGEIVYDGFVYSNASEVGEYVEGKLNINQASFSKNSATTNITVDDQNRYVSDFGGFYTQDITLSTGKGGAIYNSSPVSLNVLNSTFTSNTAARAGGAICNENAESDIYVQNSDFKSNSAKSVITTVQTHILQKGNTTKKKKITIKETVGKGGAIYTEGNVFINVADYGYAKLSEFVSNKSAYGGAIYALGKMDIHSSTFTSNAADFDGGAIYCKSNLPLADIPPEYGSPEYYFTKISEFDFSTLTSSTQHDYLYTHGYQINFDVSVLNTTFSKNSAKGNGGAIYANKVKVEGASFTNNKATAVKDNEDSGKGGAIYAQGDIVVNPFAFTAKDDGSIPMSVFKFNTAQNGGAIYTEGTSLIKNAEFTSNKASSGYGGAIYAGNDSVIVNSTFSKNSAAYGGAIYLAPSTTSYIINTNITGNTASKSGGGIYLAEDSLLYIMAYANGPDKVVDINITGNRAAGKANDIYMEQGSKIYVCAVGYDGGKATITINNVEGEAGDKIAELYCRTVNPNTKVVVKNVKGVAFHDEDDPKVDEDSTNGGIGTKLDIVAENLVKACSFY
ncbi:hypothetical protein IKJ53_05775, partial [bacterium]|nr:hypothetical protein [bacterium]